MTLIKLGSMCILNLLSNTTKNSRMISGVNLIKFSIYIESILTKKLGMSFDDIAGCDYAKEIIKETFILPNMMPHLFKGNARPWQSILIYGVTNINHF